MSDKKNLLGNTIKNARISKGLSQVKLSSMVNEEQPVISRWESGQLIPSEKNMKLLSNVLEVDLMQFPKELRNYRNIDVLNKLDVLEKKIDQLLNGASIV